MLLVPAARPDPAGFAAIVRQHQSMVYSLAWHYVRDATLAEDLAQDVFLHLHRNLGSIESAQHLTNWLRKVTIQRCIDQTRRRRLRPRLSLDEAPEPRTTPSNPDPLLESRLAEMIAGLPERHRAVVILRYQEDLEPAEIAETLGIPLGTVKSNLHRALASLRTRLQRILAPVKGVPE